MSPLGTLEAPERRPDTELDSSVDNLNAMLPDLGAVDFDKEKAEFDSLAEHADTNQPSAQSVNLEMPIAPEVPADIHEEIVRVSDNLAQAPSGRPAAPAAQTPRPQQLPAASPPAGQEGTQPPQEHQPPSRPSPSTPVRRYVFGAVDQSLDARALAGLVADKKASIENESDENAGRFKKLRRSLWSNIQNGSTVGKWFRQRRKNQALNEMHEAQDAYIHQEGITEEERRLARLDTVGRFIGAEGGYYSESAGETRAELGAESQFAQKIKDYIRQATDGRNGHLTDEEVKQANDHFKKLREDHSDELHGQGKITAHNLVEIINDMRGADMQRDALHHAIDSMVIVTGESRAESNKNNKQDLADRITDRLAGKGGVLGFVGNLVPEATVSLGVTAAMIGLELGRDTIIRKAGMVIAPGIGGAAVGALRGYQDADRRIRQHESEREAGLTFQANDKRRQALEELMYKDKTARELIDAVNKRATTEKIQESDEALKAAIKALSELTIRQGFYDNGKKVIRFSPGAKKQGELRELAKARREAVAVLGAHISTFDQQTRERFGFADGAYMADIEAMPEYGGEISREIQSDIEQKDKARNAYKWKTGAGAGAIRGAVFSGAVSLGVNLGVEAFYDSETTSATHSQSAMVNQNNGMSINGDYKIDSDFSGLSMDNFDVKGPDGNVVVENIHHDPVTGKIDATDVQRLQSAGFEVKPIDVPAVTETTTVSVGDYINSHPQEFKQLDIQWMDNNTAAFDLNEQGGQLVANPDGTVNITQSMTEGGSFHDGMGINMTDPDRRAFDMAFKQPDGTFLHKTFNYGDPIPKPWADMLYQKDDGTWGFKGGEGSHVSWGKLDGDTFYSAASVPSDGESINITDTVEKTAATTTYEIKAPEIVSDSNPTFAIAATPGARGLTKAEREHRPEVPPPPISPPYYSGRDLESMRAWVNQRPDRLRSRRVFGEGGSSGEAWVETDGSPVERSVDRERQTLRNYIENEVTKQSEHYERVKSVARSLGEMDEKTRVSVNVPAWMEAANLENLLKEWTKQVDGEGKNIEPRIYEIVVLINRKTGATPDNSVEVLNKFVDDFERDHGFRPNIRHADVELDEGYNNVGYARKLLADAVVLRSIQRSSQAGPLYIETEDADMISVDKKTVHNLITKFDNNPHLDALRGVQDRSPKHMMQNDMLFLQQRAGNFREIMARSKQFRDPSNARWNFTWNRVVTGGWNTAFTAEAYGLIDGYDIVKMGEDMSIGEKISMVRGDGNVPNLEVIGTVPSRSNSSPRRYIHELLTHRAAYSSDFTDEEVNESIRNVSLDDALKSIDKYARINDQNVESFGRWLNWSVKSFDSWLPKSSESERMKKRLLFFLGFKSGDYELNADGGVTVKSWDNVQQSLGDYRVRAGMKPEPRRPLKHKVPSTPAAPEKSKLIEPVEADPIKAVEPEEKPVEQAHEEDQKLVEIGGGTQYKVFDIGDDRVRKVPKSIDESIKSLKVWYKESEEETEKYAERLHADRDAANQHVREIAERYPDKVAFFGNPKFDSESTFEQDKATSLGKILKASTDDEKKTIITDFVHAIKESWKLGSYEKTFNYAANYGKSSDGQTILIDFGEMGFDLEEGKAFIATKPWERVNYGNLEPELKKYYYDLMESTITPEALEENWRSSLGE